MRKKANGKTKKQNPLAWDILKIRSKPESTPKARVTAGER